MTPLIYASLVLTIVSNIVLGLMVLLRAYKRPYGWYFALTLFGVVLWALGDLVMLMARRPTLVHLGAEVFYIAPTIIPMAILLFALAYPNNHRLSWRPPTFMGVILVLWAILFLTQFDAFVAGVSISDSGQNMPLVRIPGFLFYTAHFSLFFVATYVVLFRKLRHFAGLEKTQLNFTMYGVVLASIFAMIPNLSLPIMGTGQYVWMGPVLTLVFVGLVSYAIIRHQLFDIRAVIARGMGYALSLIVFASLYGLIVFGIAKFIFHISIGTAPQILISATTGVAALAFTSLKSFFDRVTDRLFFRDNYDPQELFAELNRSLVSSIDLNYLLQHTSELLQRSLKIEFCAIGLQDEGEDGFRLVGTEQFHYAKTDLAKVRSITPQMPASVIITEALGAAHSQSKHILQRNNIHALVRLAHESHPNQKGLGYIILGMKKSGNSYSSQDVQVLDTVANELIIAIQNALRFEEIQNFNATLQRTVDERTRQLKRTNTKLIMLDETKDDFISMASHQLRTPLTSVKGYLSMVLDGDAGSVTPMQRKMLDQAFVSSQRMVYLIADLLNVSRLKTGKFVIEPIQTNLAKLISDEVDQLQETARAKGLELIYKKPAHFPDLMLDETKIRQVIMNFIDNAVYYTPSNGTITVEVVDTPVSIKLFVHDTGIGVPKSDQPHLFTKFYRASNARRARPDGTGLGLFMAKKVIIASGGSMIFESKEGKGSTFGFIFAKEKLLPKGQVAKAPQKSLQEVSS